MNFSCIMYVTYLLLSNISISYAEYWLKYIIAGRLLGWEGGIAQIAQFAQTMIRSSDGHEMVALFYHQHLPPGNDHLGFMKFSIHYRNYLCCEGDYIILWTVILKNLIIAKLNTSLNTIELLVLWRWLHHIMNCYFEEFNWC